MVLGKKGITPEMEFQCEDCGVLCLNCHSIEHVPVKRGEI